MRFLIISVLIFLIHFNLRAQMGYVELRNERIFSGILPPDSGNVKSILRFAPFFNTSLRYHVNLPQAVGVFGGVGLLNLGFITKNDDYKIKRRAYVLSIPVGIQFGNFNKNWRIETGAAVEFPFHYKEKIYPNGNEKIKYTEWFSPRVNKSLTALFFNFQFSKYYALDLKYYINDFMNKNYTDGMGNKPNRNFTSNIFYVSISSSFNIKRSETYFGKRKKPGQKNEMDSIPKKKKKTEGFKA